MSAAVPRGDGARRRYSGKEPTDLLLTLLVLRPECGGVDEATLVDTEVDAECLGNADGGGGSVRGDAPLDDGADGGLELTLGAGGARAATDVDPATNGVGDAGRRLETLVVEVVEGAGDGERPRTLVATEVAERGRDANDVDGEVPRDPNDVAELEAPRPGDAERGREGRARAGEENDDPNEEEGTV